VALTTGPHDESMARGPMAFGATTNVAEQLVSVWTNEPLPRARSSARPAAGSAGATIAKGHSGLRRPDSRHGSPTSDGRQPPRGVRGLTRSRTIKVAVAVSLVAVAACGSGSAALDSRQVEKAIALQARRSYSGVAVGRARCPRRVAEHPGPQSACTVTLAGVPLRVRVSRDPRNGKLVFQALQAVLMKAALEQFVSSHLSLPGTVDCGPSPVQVIDPGQETTCQVAFADGSKQSVRVRIVDVLGNASIEGPS
jgi:hypothetical protein